MAHVRNRRRGSLLMLSALLAMTTSGVVARPAQAVSAPKHAPATFAKLPLSFELHQRASDGGARFRARGPGYIVSVTPTEARLRLEPQATSDAPQDIHMQLMGANRAAAMTGIDELPGKVNYLIGSDRSKWRSNVPTYGKVRVDGVYPGIDLIYYGSQRQLEYDFVVAPRANPRTIALRFDGAEGVRIDASGELVLRTRGGDLHLRKPVAYQDVEGSRKPVAVRYVLKSAHSRRQTPDARRPHVAFEVASYDRSRALVIDPVVSYATYFGGAFTDHGFGVALDGSRNIYIVGQTLSTETSDPPLPLVAGSYDTTQAGGANPDCFVSKLSADGLSLLYSTYIGGLGPERCYAIAVDGSGNAVITGRTLSSAEEGFPLVNAYQTERKFDYDVFVTKLTSDGAGLVFSTYLGGEAFEQANSIAADPLGNVYVTGFTKSQPFALQNAIDPATDENDAFVTKFAADGTLLYSTYLGGDGDETGENHGIVADADGYAYVTGPTSSSQIPTTGGATVACAELSYVAKFSPDGAQHEFLKCHPHGGVRIGIDPSRNVYVADGVYVAKLDQDATADIYVTDVGAAYRIAVTPTGEVYTISATGDLVTQLDTDGAVVDDTAIAGTTEGHGIAADACGNAYVVGDTDPMASGPLAPALALYPSPSGSLDAFLAKVGQTFHAYVTNLDGDTVSVIDTVSNAVVDTIPVGDQPWGAAASADGQRVFVTNFGDDTVSIIDPANPAAVTTVPLYTDANPVGVAVAPGGARVYVANSGFNGDLGAYTIAVLDVTQQPPTVEIVPLLVGGNQKGNVPFGIEVNEDRVFVVNQQGSSVTRLDAETNAVIDVVQLVHPGSTPRGIAVHPNGGAMYVASASGLSVSGPMFTFDIDLEGAGYAVAVDHDGSHAYVTHDALGANDKLSVVNTQTSAVEASITVGAGARGVSITPSGAHVYVANFGSNSVSVIATATNTLLTTITTDVGPGPVALGKFIAGPPCDATAAAAASASADGFMKAALKNGGNEGANELLVVQGAPARRALVSFDLSRLVPAPDPYRLTRARLVLNIAEPVARWPRGKSHQIKPLTARAEEAPSIQAPSRSTRSWHFAAASSMRLCPKSRIGVQGCWKGRRRANTRRLKPRATKCAKPACAGSQPRHRKRFWWGGKSPKGDLALL